MRSIPIGVILVTAWVATLSAQITRPPVSVVIVHGINTSEFTRPLRNDATSVFFVGEDIVVEWQVGTGIPALELEIPSGRLADLLDVALLESPPGAVVPRLVGTRFARNRGAGQVPEPLPAGKVFRLRPGELVSLFMKMDDVTVPGFYRLRVRPAFAGVNSLKETVQFALRPVTSRAERVELAFRSVARALQEGDCRRLRRAVQLFLTIHRFSATAHQYVGECAVKERNRKEAIAAFDRARELLDNERDDLLIENYGSEAVQKRADYLRERVAKLRSEGIPTGIVID